MSRKARTREYMELLNELDDHKVTLKECTTSIDAINSWLTCPQSDENKAELEGELEHWMKLEKDTENTIESIEAKLEELYEDGVDLEEVDRCREEGIVA